jgi:RNA polymerase sigma factor for flagellar operon FliA
MKPKRTPEPPQAKTRGDHALFWSLHGAWRKSGTKDRALAEKLVRAVKPRCDRLVVDLLRKFPHYADVEQVESAVSRGVMEGLRHLRPGRGANNPWTFLASRARGAVLDELRDLDPVSRAVRLHVKALQRDPSAKADKHTARLAAAILKGGLHMPVEDAPEAAFESGAPSPEDHAARAELRAAFIAAVETLPERQRQVIEMYARGLTLKAIGTELGVTEARACQISNEARRTLRARLNPKAD